MSVPADIGVETLLSELLVGLQETLGPGLVGLYLFGSLVSGDFDIACSDIDLLAATAVDIDAEGFRALEGMHARFIAAHPAWDDRLDIAYVSVAALQEYGTRAGTMAVLSPGEGFDIRETDPGWLVNWYLVRAHGRTLYGPPPETIIRPISREEFLHTVRDHVRRWPGWIEDLRSRKAQAYAVLTMCRALYACVHGEQVSKRRAARWAERQFPQWTSLIQDALRWRDAWRDQDVDHAATFPETRRFVHFTVRHITGEQAGCPG